jgi:SAM-dependent methyltransferase
MEHSCRCASDRLLQSVRELATDMAVNQRYTEVIAADWRDRAYYEEAEDPEWLAIFWGIGSRFRERFETLNLASVMELGCGHGRHAAQFIDCAGSVTLIDVNDTNIEFCRRRFCEHNKVEYVVNDGSSFSGIGDNRFTSMFSYDSLVHFEFEDIISYIKECHRVLAPQGRALLHMSDYSVNPGALYNANPHWRNFMSLEVASHVGQRAGFAIVSADRFPWGEPVDGVTAYDCLILFEKKDA